MNTELMKILDDMKDTRISNYVIAGLDSYSLGNGMVRLFENSRDHQDQITPHSHRFDFACLVLAGHVVNRIWTETSISSDDLFVQSEITYLGSVGEHSVAKGPAGHWRYYDRKYAKGQIYSMSAEEVHSITFSKGAKVLFFEGPEKSTKSMIIEPLVDGVRIPTYKKREYMFNETAVNP